MKCDALLKMSTEYLKASIFLRTTHSTHLFPACMRSNASLILSSGIVCVTNSSTFSFPAMYSSTNFGTLSQLFQPVYQTKLTWKFTQTHARLGENGGRFKILGECSLYSGNSLTCQYPWGNISLLLARFVLSVQITWSSQGNFYHLNLCVHKQRKKMKARRNYFRQ